MGSSAREELDQLVVHVAAPDLAVPDAGRIRPSAWRTEVLREQLVNLVDEAREGRPCRCVGKECLRRSDATVVKIAARSHIGHAPKAPSRQAGTLSFFPEVVKPVDVRMSADINIEDGIGNGLSAMPSRPMRS